MAFTFLEFQIGSNNYELRDVTDLYIFGGLYYESLTTETSRVYNLILNGSQKTDYVVGQIYGDECNIHGLNTSKMMFVKSVNGYSTATDHIAMEYALQYLNNEEIQKAANK